MKKVGILSATWLAAQCAFAQSPLALEDVMQLEWAVDPQISPDGSQIAYVRAGMDAMKDTRRGTVWLIDVDSGKQQPITGPEGTFSSPRWSPDGERLAFVASGSEGSQIFVRWMESGQVAQVTRLVQPPRNLAWSPDGTQIAFVKFIKLDQKPMVTLPSAPKGSEWADPPQVIDRLLYRADGAGYLEYGFRHLFVVPAEGGTPLQLTRGPYHHDGVPVWMADGESIVIEGNRNDNWDRMLLNSELYRVAIPDGRVTPLTDRVGPDSSPVLSPDGRYLVYTGFDDRELGYQNRTLYEFDLAEGQSRKLDLSLDRDILPIAWIDGRRILVRYDDQGKTRIARVDRRTGSVVPLVDDLGGTSIGRPYPGGSVSVSDGGRIAYVQTDPGQLGEVATLAGGEPRRLTDLNRDLFGHRDLAEVEPVSWNSAVDNLPIQGWVVKPPGFDGAKPYPMILEIHGGPFANYGPRFSAEVQLYAAAGFLVLYANPRGSTSYGEEFANEIHHNYPGDDYEDLMSGVDAMVERGWADPDRLFITGGSGGGVLTAWAVGKTDRFKAAVVAKPVINWTSFVLTADFYPVFSQYWFPDTPWNAPEHYFRRSPLSLVGNVSTPTMVLTGAADYRTPMSESEQYYQALKLREVDSVLVRVPGASHGITARPSQLMAKVAHVLAWFERYDKR